MNDEEARAYAPMMDGAENISMGKPWRPPLLRRLGQLGLALGAAFHSCYEVVVATRELRGG